MAELVGEFQEAGKKRVCEKSEDCCRAPTKTGVHENEANCKRVRAELDPFMTLNGCMDHNNSYGEEEETNTPKRLKVAPKKTIKIPGGDEITLEKLQYEVSDKELGKFSDALGRNWEFLGLELGLESPDIDRCKESFPQNTKMQIFEMLKLWKTSNLGRATMCALLEAIFENRASVNWKRINDVICEHF